MIDLWVALALVLVIEGLIPFISPGGWRRAVQQVSSLGDRELRGFGLAMMLAGVGLLYLVH